MFPFSWHIFPVLDHSNLLLLEVCPQGNFLNVWGIPNSGILKAVMLKSVDPRTHSTSAPGNRVQNTAMKQSLQHSHHEKNCLLKSPVDSCRRWKLGMVTNPAHWSPHQRVPGPWELGMLTHASWSYVYRLCSCHTQKVQTSVKHAGVTRWGSSWSEVTTKGWGH